LDKAILVTDGKLGELTTFFVFKPGEESHSNCPRFYFSFDAAIGPEIQFSATRHLAKSHIA
jgi:hypothetical protein